MTLSFTKIYICLFIFSWSQRFCSACVCVCERERERGIQTGILTLNFFSITLCCTQIQAVCLFLFYETYSTGLRKRTACPPAAAVLWLPTATRLCKTLRISNGHLHISFQNTHTFPLNHVTASAYLHRCILYREISDWRFDQESICNTVSGWFSYFQ